MTDTTNLSLVCTMLQAIREGNDSAAIPALLDYLEETGWQAPVTVEERRALASALVRSAGRRAELTTANHYSEPGCSNPELFVVFGRWARDERYIPALLVDTDASADEWERCPDECTVKTLGEALEHLGCAIEWCDEWTTCGCCGGAVRTQSDGHWWTPAYDYSEGSITCATCILKDAGSHVDQFVGGARRDGSPVLDISSAIPIDLEEEGFTLLWDDAELTSRLGSRYTESHVQKEADKAGWTRFLVVRDQRQYGLALWIDSEELANRNSVCPNCGEELDTDCQGQKRCPDCDGPCPCCSDQ